MKAPSRQVALCLLQDDAHFCGLSPGPSHSHFYGPLPWLGGSWTLPASPTGPPSFWSPWVLWCFGPPPRPPHEVPLTRPDVAWGRLIRTPIPPTSLLNGASHSERPPCPGAPKQAEVEGHQDWWTPRQFGGSCVVCGPRLLWPQGLAWCQSHLMGGSVGFWPPRAMPGQAPPR